MVWISQLHGLPQHTVEEWIRQVLLRRTSVVQQFEEQSPCGTPPTPLASVPTVLLPNDMLSSTGSHGKTTVTNKKKNVVIKWKIDDTETATSELAPDPLGADGGSIDCESVSIKSNGQSKGKASNMINSDQGARLKQVNSSRDAAVMNVGENNAFKSAPASGRLQPGERYHPESQCSETGLNGVSITLQHDQLDLGHQAKHAGMGNKAVKCVEKESDPECFTEEDCQQEMNRIASGFVAAVLAGAVAEYIAQEFEDNHKANHMVVAAQPVQVKLDMMQCPHCSVPVEAAKYTAAAAMAAHSGDPQAAARAVMEAARSMQHVVDTEPPDQHAQHHRRGVCSRCTCSVS
ncbi:uncharacterized protein LOC106151899 [Lingula anatina]|uniref:Uncharacterized protein LOC106151899 n=1 Tax=Lingula anatina TaxID=7574 RepID=A0A1S3H4A5_LINAN|nr:uncharacterized protein LOC106151899 [Lingula anatina]|eukprot:XP_013380792.1 uncharacterized protein LOC106151899 [Lingula anatina]